jgi:tetratricopeptide (TPR) repeat protein
VDYLSRQKPDEARKALAEIERSPGQLSAQQEVSLWNRLAALHARLGDVAQTERLWKRVAERQPHDLTVRQRLFELALQKDDDALMVQLAADLNRIEGIDGTLWRYGEAARLVLRARKGDLSGLARARTLLAEAARLRSDWAQVPVLQAEIKELEKDTNGALELYQQALKLGERRTAVIRRAAQLLGARNRHAEANELIKRFVPEPATAPGELGRMAAQLSLFNQERDRALDLARRSVSPDSKDYRDHLWQGQMLSALQQPKEAEEALRRAVQLKPDTPEPWVALVLHLIGSGKKAEAEKTIEEAGAKLPAAQAPLALAPCYEALGQFAEAEKYYTASLAEKPDHVPALRNKAAFHHRRGEFVRAEAYFQRLLVPDVKASEADRAWARRQLARVLVSQHGTRKLDEALALLDQNRKAHGLMPEDQRIRALLIMLRPGGRREAIRLLEELRTQQGLAPEDLFQLVQLYEGSRDWIKMDERAEALLTAYSRNATYLAHYTNNLIQRNRLDLAEGWLNQLEKVAPESLEALVLRARLLRAQGQTDKAVGLLEKAVEDKDDLLAPVAAVVDEMGQAAAAEKLYRKLVEKSKRPESVLLLVRFLARQKKIDEALELCDKAREKVPPESMASVAVAVLRQEPVNPKHCQRVDGWIAAGLEKNPGNLTLLLTRADLLEYQRRYDEAQKIYQDILAKQSRNFIALNNLAWLMALKDGKTSEALNHVQTALETSGPIVELLDTRGVVYWKMGRHDQAVKDLEEVVAVAPSASRYFHLAQAHHGSGDLRKAQNALQEAKKLGLKPEKLHPLEQPAYENLEPQLKPK